MPSKILCGLLLFGFAQIRSVVGCEDAPGHVHSLRSRQQLPAIPPSRPLEWGDFNVIHTTDSHGWLLGHQKTSPPEPNYSADLGDFTSFVTHMKEIALEKDVDILLVDSGDLHDGTGLSDGFPPGGVDGRESNDFLKRLPYDVMAIGNHELYIYNITRDMHDNFAPALKGRYLSSNVNITITDERNNAHSVPVGSRFTKFKTRKGRSVTALGVMFEFTGNDHNTTVQKVADMVKESWFSDAIQDEPDVFLLVGHMPVARDKWPVVFDAIRAVHPTTPILIAGGHSHIRDCLQLDGRSISLESGRYMETIGWMSAKLNVEKTKNITFSRRYLDANRVTYEFHTKKKEATFDTPTGLAIRKGLKNLAKIFNLDFLYGTAPQDYKITGAPYPSNGSLLSLFAEQAVPVALAINNTRADIPSYLIIQAGSLRYDIFSGTFTKNDQLTASPFTNAFVFIPDVPLNVAMEVLPILNGIQAAATKRDESPTTNDLYARGEVEWMYRAWLEDMYQNHIETLRRARSLAEDQDQDHNLTLGYVTQDACPGIGDDIPHTPIQAFPLPNAISSQPPKVAANDSLIDFVFSDFIQPNVLDALNAIQKDRVFTNGDVESYSPLLFKDILGLYAQKAWN